MAASKGLTRGNGSEGLKGMEPRGMGLPGKGPPAGSLNGRIHVRPQATPKGTGRIARSQKKGNGVFRISRCCRSGPSFHSPMLMAHLLGARMPHVTRIVATQLRSNACHGRVAASRSSGRLGTPSSFTGRSLLLGQRISPVLNMSVVPCDGTLIHDVRCSIIPSESAKLNEATQAKEKLHLGNIICFQDADPQTRCDTLPG